ncbi:MAG: PBP1A family penicillin-binding protein [Aquificae bacterium]|nr:PBP1A family penicillin-binding protein [Aquificota bacterium]
MKFFFLFIFVFLLSSLSVFVFLFVKKNSQNLPDVRKLEEWEPAEVSYVYDINGKVLTKFFIQNRYYVSIDKIPKYVRDAFVAIEDKTFYENSGIDIAGIFRAAIQNLSEGRIVAGGSTISQQLIKNLFLTPEKSFSRKFKEMLLAIKLNEVYPKDKILEMYLNQIYLGHGAYGIEAAARTYFGKHVWQLDVCEGATLAALPKAPSRYDPYKNIDLATKRRNLVIKRMLEDGYIDFQTAKRCWDTPIVLRKYKEDKEQVKDYFTEMVRKWFKEHFGLDELYKGGYKIYTTVDKNLLITASMVVKDHLERLQAKVGFPKMSQEEIEKLKEMYQDQEIDKLKSEKIYLGIIEKIEKRKIWITVGEHKGYFIYRGNRRYLRIGLPVYVRYIKDNQFEFVPYLESALISIDPKTGAIRAVVGGYDFEKSKFNRAVQAKRQVGSSFKPFVYAKAIMRGYTQITRIKDEPLPIWDPEKKEEWLPSNYDHEYRGDVTLRYALTRSLNAASVNLFMKIGIKPVIRFAKELGIKSYLPPVPSLVLGSADISPLEMASAYSTFANQGSRCEPYFIEKVVDKEGNVVYEHKPLCIQIIPEEENAIVVDLLRGVIKEGTGKKARRLGFPVAGKTGTTNNYTDAWFIGFSTQLATAVWVGYDIKKRIGKRMTGSTAALPIWIDFMASAHAGKKVRNFPLPRGVVYVPIDPHTNLIANEICPGRYILFVRGTAPDIDCEGNFVNLNRFRRRTVNVRY